MEPKRFYRSDTNNVFAGVCGGIAEYFTIDPILVRLLFVILVFAGGSGVLIYLILWIAAPVKPKQQPGLNNPSEQGSTEHSGEPQQKDFSSTDQSQIADLEKKQNKIRRGWIGGLVLITLGLLFLIDEFIPCLGFGDLWPFLLVVIGVGLLINGISTKRNKEH